jgi:hypothetical protein
MLSQESEAPFNASDKSFVRVFLQFQLLKQSIVCPNRFTQLVSDGRQDKNIIHVAQIKPVGSGRVKTRSIRYKKTAEKATHLFIGLFFRPR